MRIKLYLDKRPNKSGAFPVRVSISFMGRRFISSLGCAMSMNEFAALNGDFNHTGFRKQTCHPKHKELLRQIKMLEDRLEWEAQKVVRGEIKPDDVRLDEILNECKGTRKKSVRDGENFKETYLKFVRGEASKKDYAEGTVLQLYTSLKIILAFDPDVSIRKMATAEWMERYAAYNIGRGLNNISVRGLHVRAHWFLMWCYRNGLCGNDFERYHLELKTVDTKEKLVVFLTMDEIMSIQALPLDGTIAVARDFFLFQCFTGLRCSDVHRLRKTDIQNDTLHIVTQKTGASIHNKLNKYALDLIAAYKDSPFDTLFPPITSMTLNRLLRDIGKLAGIDEPVCKVDYRNHKREEMIVPKWQLLTTHVGRKSFVVNSLDFGLTATQVIGYTGHSSIRAMQPYISISQKKKDAAMDVWNNAIAANENVDELEKLNLQMEALKKRIDDLKKAKYGND